MRLNNTIVWLYSTVNIQKCIVTAMMLCVICTGCTSPKISAPANISDRVLTCASIAKSRIEAHHVSLKKKSDCRVVVVPATGKNDGRWIFSRKELGLINVVGFYDGNNIIHIACNPANLADVQTDSLLHEFAHYWLVTNFGDWTHNPIYRNDFILWR